MSTSAKSAAAPSLAAKMPHRRETREKIAFGPIPFLHFPAIARNMTCDLGIGAPRGTGRVSGLPPRLLFALVVTTTSASSAHRPATPTAQQGQAAPVGQQYGRNAKMSDRSGFDRPAFPVVAPPQLPAEALAGVRTRRIVAFCFDLIFVSILSFSLWLALAVLTFGLSFFILPPLFPIVAFFYNGLTISGYRMATPGMRAMDLEVRLTDGTRVPFLNAAVQAVLFYVSTMFPPVFLVSLLSANKRCLHDMLAGVIVTRRFM
jgi:uncharacterized RDD family membrane protein YckC